MRQNVDFALRLSSGGTVYRFLRISEAPDWSVIITRDVEPPAYDELHSFAIPGTAPTQQAMPVEPARVTYHTTGQLNVHGLGDRPPLYFEPLPEITEPLFVFGLSVPNLEKLDPLKKAVRPDDRIVEVGELASLGRLAFDFFLTRHTAMLDVPNTILRHHFDFGSLVGVSVRPRAVPAGFEDRFLYYTPEKGRFRDRQMTKAQATLAYHQRRSGLPGLGIYAPNGEGVYKLFPAVEMRIVPALEIDFCEPGFRVEVQLDQAKPYLVPFRLYRGRELVKRNDLRPLIRRIMLNARMSDPVRDIPTE